MLYTLDISLLFLSQVMLIQLITIFAIRRLFPISVSLFLSRNPLTVKFQNQQQPLSWHISNTKKKNRFFNNCWEREKIGKTAWYLASNLRVYWMAIDWKKINLNWCFWFRAFAAKTDQIIEVSLKVLINVN